MNTNCNDFKFLLDALKLIGSVMIGAGVVDERVDERFLSPPLFSCDPFCRNGKALISVWIKINANLKNKI